MTERRLPWALVLAACLLTAIAYRSEVTDGAPEVNDAIFHLALVDRVSATGSLDPWIPYWGMGFPVLRYYQHLPHVAVVLVHRLLLQRLPLPTVYHGLLLGALALLPAAFYFGARRLGLARHTSALAALCVPLVAVDPNQRFLFGIGPLSFVWLGSGLFPQLIALLFFLPAIGTLHEAAIDGRRPWLAVLLLWATWMSHLLLGYSACLLGLLVVLRSDAAGDRPRVLRRVLVIYAVTALGLLHLLLPTVRDSALLNRSIWEDPIYWDSYGAAAVLRNLATGALFDGPRLPVLTILVGLGAVVAVVRRFDAAWEAQRAVLLGFVVAVLLYFGRPFWGALLVALPFSHSLPLHRFLPAVQTFGVLLAAIALGALWQRLDWQRSARRAALALAATLGALAPAWLATASFARWNGVARATAAAELARNRAGLDAVMDRLVALDHDKPGRGYAGASWNWGKDYKLAGAPIYTFWSERGLSSIGYLFHTMSLNSDLEPHFDERRQDHYDLFNVNKLLVPNRSFLPPFAKVIAEAPGIVAATVETKGIFEIVGAPYYLDATTLTRQQLYSFNRRFVESRWHQEGRFVHLARQPDPPLPGETVLSPAETFAPLPFQRPRGRIVNQERTATGFEAELELEEPAWIVVKVTFHPRWEVVVDGKPLPTRSVVPALLVVRVEREAKRVAVRFR